MKLVDTCPLDGADLQDVLGHILAQALGACELSLQASGSLTSIPTATPPGG